MTQTAFSDALRGHGLHPRRDLVAALDRTWQRLAEPGQWLTGAQRVAIARSVRQSWNCPGCGTRKAALSPYAKTVDHSDTNGDLDPEWVELIHFTIRDSGRMTSRSYERALSSGMAEDDFVEIVSVATLTQMIDVFSLGIGLPQMDLSAPLEGTPPRIRTEKASPGPGWVPTIAGADASEDFQDFYANGYDQFYIRRSLTLVPRQVRQFWDLGDALYLPDPRASELDGIERSISRAQMEFLAARSSALLGCFY